MPMFFFSDNKIIETKLEGLESKLNDFEKLSREMSASLSSAIEKIGEANQTISKCLVSHEERLKQSEKNETNVKDTLYAIRYDSEKKIEDIKKENDEEHKKIFDQIKTIDTKLDDIDKFRFKVTGAILIIGFLLGAQVLNIFITYNHPSRNGLPEEKTIIKDNT